MKVCLSIDPPNVPAARAMLNNVSSSVDLVELRIDAMYQPDLDALLRRPRPPVIVTNRCSEEGGGFNGKAQDQYAVLEEACSYHPEYVDVELRWGLPFYKKLARRFPRTRFILSHHDYGGTPANLLPLYQRMRKAGSAIIKIATIARCIGDNAPMFRLLEQARRDKQPMVGFCMGEYGQPSRIMCGKFGAFLTFGFNANGHPTAPGQLSSDDLTMIFRAHAINKGTRVFGLVGNPISHSKGIYYHNSVFQQKQLNAVYINFLADCFSSFHANFHANVAGVSITMPFKQEAVSFADRFGDDSRDLGAINTLVFLKGKATGYNTDFSAVQSILRKNGSLKGKHAIVLGTGGMARTMAYAAIRAGARTTIAGRSTEKAAALAGDLGCSAVAMDEMYALPCDLLMNGTSVGMSPETDPELVAKRFFKNTMTVMDAVYTPEMTRLLLDAKAAGCPIITGQEIFKKQAALQSALFIGTI